MIKPNFKDDYKKLGDESSTVDKPKYTAFYHLLGTNIKNDVYRLK